MMLLATAPGPSPLWFATRGAGVASLVLLTATVVLGIGTSLRVEGPRTPRFVVAGLHRNLSLFTLLLLLVHIVTAVVDPFAGLSFLDALLPFAAAYRPLWLGLGVLAAEALVALAATSLLRRRVGARWWRRVHWLAYAAWPLALVHGLGTGSDAQQPWMLGLTAACVTAVAVALATRLARGGWRTAPVRALSAVVAVGVLGIVGAWAASGPLQPDWAVRAGTPAAILARSSATPAVPAGPFQDRLVGTLVRTPSGQVEISLRDVADPSLTAVIMPPGASQTLPEVTLYRGSRSLCHVPARATTSFYAVCNSVRLVIALSGVPPRIGGTLTASGPLR